MAEERRLEGAGEESPSERSDAAPAAAPAKKKKKSSKFATFLWLILLGLGVAVGLHLSGYCDGRPLFWSVVPRLPYVCKPLAEFFHIPAEYSLTVHERRTIELKDWQRRLDERERSLTGREGALDTLSGDLVYKMEDLERRETLLLAASSDARAQPPTPGEQELINQVARTYQDMSARNAAAVVEQLRDELAVDLLMKLPNDARASILGKMKPQRAARLTEMMAGQD